MQFNKGFTLVEMLVVVVLMSIAITFVIVPQLEIQKNLINTEKKATRILQTNNLKQFLISDQDSLVRSAFEARELSSLCPCVLGGASLFGGTKTCKIPFCKAGVETDFSLYNNTLVRLSGTAELPVYYFADGSVCSNNDKMDLNLEKICSYKIITKFKANCAGDIESCDHAEYLIVSIEKIPVGAGMQQIAYEKTQLFYPVSVNYPPYVGPIANQNMVVNAIMKLAVNAEAGFPGEDQKVIFEKCESSNPDVVDVKCYKFVSGVGQMVLSSRNPGTAKISFQINDGSRYNSLSEISSFNLTVSP